MNTGYLGDTTPKLGFGLMRLPMIGDEIDMEQTKAMVDTFMTKGFTYFDTAYVYINGKSEVAAREAIVKRYPRDSFTLATKLPLWDNIETEADMQRIFDESMERAGVEYFDYYLLHAMDKAKFEKADRIVNSTPFVRQYDIMFNRWGDFNAKGSTKQTIYAGVQENGCRNHEKRTSEYPCNDAGIWN